MQNFEYQYCVCLYTLKQFKVKTTDAQLFNTVEVLES